MSDLTRALYDFARLFERLSVPYAVMGGLAVRVYGIPRPTYDVDFTVALARDRLPILFDAVRELGYTVPEVYEKGWIDQVAGMPLVKARLYLAERGVDVDIFLSESPFQRQLLARRRLEPLEDTSIWIVSPEDVILLKLLARRPRDLADIGDVLFTQGQLDEAYLRTWADRLGVRTELNLVLAEPPIP